LLAEHEGPTKPLDGLGLLVLRTPLPATPIPQALPISAMDVEVAEMTQSYLQATALLRQQAAQIASARAAASTRAAMVSQTATSSATTAPGSQTSASTGSGGWSQVAICEEGGSNSYTYGYFGITPQSWGDYAGVSTAGQADWDTQVTRADQINGGPPWCPPNCAAGGYRGW
jgi:hypothetical protein